MHIAKVIVNVSLDRYFDYIIPEEFLPYVKTGVQVFVSFRNSRRRAYVVGLSETSTYDSSKLKKIEGICENHPKIPENLLALGKWIAEYYCCSQEQSVKALLPLAVRGGKVGHKTISHYSVKTVEDAQKFVFEKGKKHPAKKAVLEYLLKGVFPSKEILKHETKASDSILRSLIKEGLIIEDKRKIFRSVFTEDTIFMPITPPQLTEEQTKAMQIVDNVFSGQKNSHVVLLHGVTASGKTEVYMRSIEKCLQMQKETIVLVPEIALTPQTVERFIGRFGQLVSVLHSGLSDGERYDEWMKIYKGLVKIVVGARSALFAPFRNLGLIVVDEEHENSYKQDEAPRYNARDAAVMRAYMENAVVILGSATPSFESYNNALSGKYILSNLKNRVDNRVMPVMKIVDMKAEILAKGRSLLFSEELISKIRDRIDKREQVIIFLNRRGFATQMMCKHCGFVAKCSQCSVSYTYYKQRACLSCHLCGVILQAYYKCPDCGASDIRLSGTGTEKIENMLSEFFPHAKIKRMDSDTMRGQKNLYEKIFREFRSGKIDILVGTQIIAKGLDFPKVTLVGIINADTGLHLPDFRAPERTFQLLTQVAGRSGRGDRPGEVLIQTFSPGNPAIQYAVRHDYVNFYKEEMEIRNLMKYPPCGHLTTLFFKGTQENETANFANEFLERLRPSIHRGIFVSGPAPAPISKIKNKFRYMIVLRGWPMKELRNRLRNEILHGKKNKNISTYADIDAQNML